MPDKKSQIKFDADYIQKLNVSITRSIIIFNRIEVKLRRGRQSDLNRVQLALIDIKQYAYVNMAIKPAQDKLTLLKHDPASLLRIRKGKQSLKVLFNTLRSPAQKQNKPGYAATLDIFNRFEGYLDKIIAL